MPPKPRGSRARKASKQPAAQQQAPRPAEAPAEAPAPAEVRAPAEEAPALAPAAEPAEQQPEGRPQPAVHGDVATAEATPAVASAEEGVPPVDAEPAPAAAPVQQPEPAVARKFTCLTYTGPNLPLSDSLPLPKVVELIRQGEIVAESVVWSAGFDPAKGHNGWVPFESVVELFDWPEGFIVPEELAAAAARKSNEAAASIAKAKPEQDAAVRQPKAVSAAIESAAPETVSEAEPEPEQEPEQEPEPEPEAAPEPEPNTAEVQPRPPDLPHVPGLPRRVRLLGTHVVSTWNANIVYYILECNELTGADDSWTTIKRFSEFKEIKTSLGIGAMLAAPFPSEKGLEEQTHATPQAAADWLQQSVKTEPLDAGAQMPTSSTHLVLVPWADDATACWKWESGLMWSSVKPLQEIVAQLKDRKESKPVLLSVYGNVRVVGCDAAVPMPETHLPIWCTTSLQLAQDATQNTLKKFFSVNDACMAILSLDLEVSPGLLDKCGGAVIEGIMEKEGQRNTSFQKRYFALWPREECKIVARGFRVLYYFESASATKAKGRIRVDQPDLEELTKERNGQCVMRISPNGETSAEDTGSMTLDSLLESLKQPPLEARALTLRWLSSDQSDDFEQMERWSTALGARRVNKQFDVQPLDVGDTSKALEDAGKTDVMTSAQRQRTMQFEAGMSDQEMQVGTRMRVEGYGLGVYERFEKSTFGANSHFIRFESDINKLELPKLRWAVLDETEDGIELELEWGATTESPSPSPADTSVASASSEQQQGSEPEPKQEPEPEPEQKPEQQALAQVTSADPQRPPPCGLCWKRKQNMGFTWPERYIKLWQPGGKAYMGLYVFTNEGDAEPRKTSIEKLIDVEVTKGIENWKLAGNKFKLTLSADFLAEKSAEFCFEQEDVRDEFFDACVNLAAGRPWYLSAAQEAQAKAEEEEREKQRVELEIKRRVAEEVKAAEAEAAEAIRVAKEKAVEEERQRAAKEAQEKKIKQAQAAMARKEKEAAEKATREEAETSAAAEKQESSEDGAVVPPVGTKVQVWSAGFSQWCDGAVKQAPAECGGIVVTYRAGGKKKTKTIPYGSKDLKILPADDATISTDSKASGKPKQHISLDPTPVGLAPEARSAGKVAASTADAQQAATSRKPTAAPSSPASPASFDGAGAGSSPRRKGPHKIGCGFLFILPEAEFVADDHVTVCEDNMCEHVFVDKGSVVSATKYRRHHCRSCGHLFCGKCSSERFRLIDPESATGATRKERVCDQCFTVLTKGQEPSAFEK